jgi:pyocin large subunit-like protein
VRNPIAQVGCPCGRGSSRWTASNCCSTGSSPASAPLAISASTAAASVAESRSGSDLARYTGDCARSVACQRSSFDVRFEPVVGQHNARIIGGERTDRDQGCCRVIDRARERRVQALIGTATATAALHP